MAGHQRSCGSQREQIGGYVHACVHVDMCVCMCAFIYVCVRVCVMLV